MQREREIIIKRRCNIMFCTSSALPSPPTVLFLPSTDPPYNLLKTHPSLALLSQCKSRQTLTQIHAQFFKFGLHNTHFALSKLIEFCAISPHGDISYAISVFESIGEPNLITWNTLIRGLSLSSSPYLGLIYYVAMIENSIIPNNYSFPFVFKCCAKGGAAHEGKQIHGHVVKFGLSTDAFVHTSIINMYAQVGQLGMAQLVFDKSSHRGAVSCTALISGYVSGGLLDEARRVFDDMDARDVVTWNAMIAGYGQSHRFEDALDLFREMIRDNVKFNESTLVSVLSACAQSDCVKLGDWIRSWIEDHGLSDSLRLGNALIDMYAKCGNLDMARRLFDGLKKRDVISWNVMIGGYTHSSRYKEALALFRQMQGSDEEPNDVTFISILPACAYLGALDLGKWIHAYIEKNVMSVENTSLWTSLIDMYAKCGNIKVARQVFDGMKVRSLSAWNAMISGFAMHGHPNAAFKLFSEMIDEGFLPDDITFVAVLSACSHAGLVDSGQKYFASMIRDYNITPKFHHYGCMIDLLGRAGLFEEVDNLMKNMEMSPDAAIWSSLLGACKIHGKVDLGEFVAGQLLELEPENHGAYVLLSNIYAGAGRWDDVARVRTQLNDTGMKKLPGCSSIEVDSVVHEFLVGDKVHPQSKDIYKMLEEIDRLLERAGFVPDTSEVLFNMDEEWKEGALCHHSEKLAIAFGLISTKPGSTIRIVKNLRVCGNCHSATKLISKIFKREIIARDRNRFHHFKDGSCSCMDYW